jgi:hypothetical protein
VEGDLHRFKQDVQKKEEATVRRDEEVDRQLKELRDMLEAQGRMTRSDRASLIKWTERVDQLEDELDVAKAQIASMAGQLCQCNRAQEVEVTSEGVLTPALSYESDTGSYHTPPREGSHNDSNAENVAPVDRLAGIPEGARLVPICSDIDEYQWSEGGDEAAEAMSDAMDQESRRRYLGARVVGSRVFRQCARKTFKATDYHPYRRSPGKVTKRRVFGETKRERNELRGSERAMVGRQSGVGGYESDSESGRSEGASDVDTYALDWAQSRDVSPRYVARRSSRNPSVARPSSKSRSRGSSRPRLVELGPVVPGVVGEPDGARGRGDSLWPGDRPF